MAESHASLRDRYQVSCPELDVPLEAGIGHARRRGLAHDGGRVRRLHGDAGAAGGGLAALGARARGVPRPAPGRTPRMWTLRAVDGARFIED